MPLPDHVHTRVRRLAALLATLALAAPAMGCAPSHRPGHGPAPRGVAAGAPSPYRSDDFYRVPDPLPTGPHGTLIRYQPMAELRLPGAVAYRIMYVSESVRGTPIAVTGTASVPTTAAPKAGRPMVTVAHGTTGIADACAPSKDPSSNEMPLVGGHLGARYLLAMTDYEGLGTPGRHPYLVGESEGRGVMDAIVAAGQLPDAHPGTKVAIAGYSQGGHGALWAAQVAPAWAPGLELVGTFAGAPASEVGVALAAAPHLPSAGFAYLAVAGIAAAYPEAAHPPAPVDDC